MEATQEKIRRDLEEKNEIASIELERARLKIDELQLQRSEIQKSYFQIESDNSELSMLLKQTQDKNTDFEGKFNRLAEEKDYIQ